MIKTLRLYMVLLTVALPTLLCGDELSRVEVAAIARGSTVQIDQNGSRIATGFCINPMGMIVCTNETIPENGYENVLSVVFDAGLKNEHKSLAKIIRRDKERNLALLSVESGPVLPALRLGMDEDLSESTELIAAGFPFDTIDNGTVYLRVLNVKVVNVNTLLRDDKAAVLRLHFDPTLNSGFAGGPLLNRAGNAAGIVGRLNAVSDFAIPVSHIRQFLERPILVFTPPIVEADRKTSPAEFRVTARQVTSEPAELELELVLTLEGSPERRFPMKKVGLEFLAEVVPFPGAKVLPQSTAAIHCEIIASKKGGIEVGRLRHRLFLHGTPNANLDAIKVENYIKPLESGEPTNYLSAISAPGEFIGGGATLNYQNAFVQTDGGSQEIRISIDGWNLTFAVQENSSPNNTLKVGEYRTKKVDSYRQGRLRISGRGRGNSNIDGSFAIWELELDKKNGNRIVRLAIDFFQRSKDTGLPFYGMLRFNSTLQ